MISIKKSHIVKNGVSKPSIRFKILKYTINFFSAIKAAALLKRAEGIVTLIVCNPNKKDDKKEEISKTPKAEKKGKNYKP